MLVHSRAALLLVASFGIAALVAFAVVQVRAQIGGGYVNPDAGLSDEAKNAKYQTASARSVNQQATAVAIFESSGAELGSLPRVEGNGFYAGSEYDLAGASAAAVAVIQGTVKSQRLVQLPGFPAARRVVSTIEVTQALKGQLPSSSVELEQAAAPVLRDDGTYALVINDNDPVVSVGEEVILFAASVNEAGRYVAIPFKTLDVTGGVVLPNPGDSKGQDLKGTPAGVVRESIQRALNEAAGDSQPQTVLPAEANGRRRDMTIEQLRSFPDFPVYWLGDQYKGLPLRRIIRNVFIPGEGSYSGNENLVLLMYGDCVAPPDSSCSVPLAIRIEPACMRPPDTVAAGAFDSPPFSVRGAQAALIAGHLQIWTADVSISIYVRGGGATMLDAAADLVPANGGMVPQVADITANSSLPDFAGGC